jgi:hypothetical protein
VRDNCDLLGPRLVALALLGLVGVVAGVAADVVVEGGRGPVASEPFGGTLVGWGRHYFRWGSQVVNKNLLVVHTNNTGPQLAAICGGPEQCGKEICRSFK